ncbi:MAG: glycosyl hydrolase family 18 protein [Melioribacteraceae bacterium]|nr:glycosyl hydrolase family 18 protein [Melioribacteraceae bacterium]
MGRRLVIITHLYMHLLKVIRVAALTVLFKLYNKTRGVPSEKITLCAAFFGYSYADCDEMYSPHQGADTTLFPKGQDIFYSQIAEKMNQFERRWGFQKRKHLTIVGKTRNTLISFDDEESVALKAEYINENNGAGIIIWPLMGDYLNNGETPLLDSIYQQFNK